MHAKDIILVWVFPVLGGIIGCMMFAAPLKAVLRAMRQQDLGSLNPLPYPAQVANTVGWIAYTYVLAATDRQASAMIYWVSERSSCSFGAAAPVLGDQMRLFACHVVVQYNSQAA